MIPVLDPTEARVLGCLLEKEVLVPDAYPMTLKALVAACNQSTSREPVLSLTPDEVEAALERLKLEHRVVRKVLPSHGSRSVKHRHVLPEVVSVDDAQRALLTVLLLRGPQTPQELRTRTGRLHTFAAPGDVEEVLVDMAGWGEPLVRPLPRTRGQRDTRWAHLLCGEPDSGSPQADATGSRSTEGSPPPRVDPDLHGLLAPFVGVWEGTGDGHYPTIEAFSYRETIEIRPIPGKPICTYSSTTRSADGSRGLHAETGFLRVVGPDRAELVVAAAPGLVETCAGSIRAGEPGGDGVEMVLTSTGVHGTPTAVEVTATARTYSVADATLTYDVSMAAVGQPTSHHLRAVLTRR